MDQEQLEALCKAAVEAAKNTKAAKAEDPNYEADADAAYEAILDMWNCQDHGKSTILRAAFFPDPSLGAPPVFAAFYKASLGL